MIMKASRGSTFGYTSSYWTSTNTLNTGDINRNDGNSKFHSYNYLTGTDVMAYFPDATSVTLNLMYLNNCVSHANSNYETCVHILFSDASTLEITTPLSFRLVTTISRKISTLIMVAMAMLSLSVSSSGLVALTTSPEVLSTLLDVLIHIIQCSSFIYIYKCFNS